MEISILGLLLLLLVAAVCGAIGRSIAGSSRGGLVLSIVLGFVGALLGSWLAGTLGLPEPFLVNIDGRTFPVLWSIIGAALFVALIHLISGKRV